MVNSANTPDGGKEPVKELADALDREIKGLVSAQSLARWIWSLLFLAYWLSSGHLFLFFTTFTRISRARPIRKRCKRKPKVIWRKTTTAT